MEWEKIYFSKDNCRWITMKEQANNKQKSGKRKEKREGYLIQLQENIQQERYKANAKREYMVIQEN